MKKSIFIVICLLVFALPLSSGATYWSKMAGRESGLFPDGSYTDVQAVSDYGFIAVGTKLEGLTDINMNQAWISLDTGETIEPFFSPGEVAQGLFCQSLILINTLYFFNENNGFLFGSWGNSYDNCGVLTVPTNYIASTFSQGGAWDAIYLQPVLQNTELTAVDFLDDLNGVIAGESDNIWMTQNGGGSWDFVAADAPDYGGYASAVSYVSSSQIYIAGGGLLIKTNNGGLSWETVDMEDAGSVREVQFLDSDHGWLLVSGGDEGIKTLVTSDGGDTWETGEFPLVPGVGDPGDDYTVHDFTMLSRHVGWAVGSDYGNLTGTSYQSVIFKTVDGGLTWEADDYFGAGGLYAVSMYNGRNGFAVGEANTVLHFANPNNATPIAEAGDAVFATVDQTVTLDGGESFDEDGDALTYQWALIDGPEAVAFDDATLETPSFSASTAGEYVISLQVFDGAALSDADQVQVIFDPVPGSDDDDDDTDEIDQADDDDEDDDDGSCCG